MNFVTTLQVDLRVGFDRTLRDEVKNRVMQFAVETGTPIQVWVGDRTVSVEFPTVYWDGLPSSIGQLLTADSFAKHLDKLVADTPYEFTMVRSGKQTDL